MPNLMTYIFTYVHTVLAQTSQFKLTRSVSFLSRYKIGSIELNEKLFSFVDDCHTVIANRSIQRNDDRVNDCWCLLRGIQFKSTLIFTLLIYVMTVGQSQDKLINITYLHIQNKN
jgi:hypothetical protein